MNVLELENVDLIYQSTESLSFRHLIGKGKNNVIQRYKALNDVSLTIEKGKVYGIVGTNGAGKSTLLRVLVGVMAPNSGRITRNYNSISLLALGIGFTKSLTGVDNIFLSGMLLGFSKKQIAAILDDIIEYSELGEFAYRPMKTYSSGMVSRLGFSIAINLRPEVLLIDEVLSVGDAKFKEKSYATMQEIIKDEETTVVLVSHSSHELRAICDKAIWLDKGEVIAQGEAIETINWYAHYYNGRKTIEEIKKEIKEGRKPK